jgi:ABC-type lipoprotein release transport system permease subunit
LLYALGRARARCGRQVLAAAGIAAAAAVLGASVTVADSLTGGFARTAQRADLPDVLASFAPVQRARAASVVSTLPNVRAVSYLLQQAGANVSSGDLFDGHATVIGLRPGRHGYAIVAGHDLTGPGQVVIEAGLARAWGLRPGDSLLVGYAQGERLRVVGVAVAPDTVAFPLTHGPRVYVGYRDAAVIEGESGNLVNGVDLWLADPRLLAVTLAQARSASFGLSGLQFVTRAGLQLLIGQAAGIVIAVLVAFSLIALVVAGVMLSASAAAEAQRRLVGVGVLRAVGVPARSLVAAAAVEAGAVALPVGAIGVSAGWLAVRGPTERLLASLNELPPGPGLWLQLAGTTAGAAALVIAASCWPTWRATRRPPAEVLRGGDIAPSTRRLPLPPRLPALGLRLLLARPARSAATVTVVASAVAVVLAMLAIASVLQNLNRQPLSVGKRYQLVVDAPASELRRIAGLPQVAGAAPMYTLQVADSFSLDEPFTLVAFGAPPDSYEDPPLSAGTRVRSADEVDVGLGLADALDLHPGGVLAAQLPNGRELRFRVAGIVQALEDQGRIAYVEASRLLAAVPRLQGQVAVRLKAGASAAAVSAAVARRGEATTSAGGIAGQSVQNWAVRSSGFLGILVGLLRSIAVLDALVCLYAIAQAIALTAQERRRTLAVLRAQGAGRTQLFTVFAAAAGTLVLLAALLAAGLERWLLAPEIARLAAAYVVLALAAGGRLIAATTAGLLGGSAFVAALLTRLVTRDPVVAGLREE